MRQYKLDVLDAKILFELDLNSRQSAVQLAKKVRISKEKANFRVKRLVSKGFIKSFLTTVNTSQLGFYYYKVFYKFYRISPKKEKEIEEFIRSYSQIAWFGLLEGYYDLAFLILAESFKDVEKFLGLFREQFGETILLQEIHVLTSVHRFNLKFFCENKVTHHSTYPQDIARTHLIKEEKTILRALANNARISVLDLAKKIGLSSSTVIYHIRKLKEKKILGTHVLAINFEKFGVQHYQINISLIQPSVVEKIISFASDHPLATFATTTIGKYDLALEFVAKDVEQLRAIISLLKQQFSEHIVVLDTSLIVKELVVSWFPKEV